MKRLPNIKYSSFLILLMFACISVSCSDQCDDCDDCDDKSFELYLKIVDGEGNDLTSSESVQSVNLFIFDQNGTYLERRSLEVADVQQKRPFLINMSGGDKVTIVAWSNMYVSNSIDRSELSNLYSLDVPVYISLLEDESGDPNNKYNRAPSDIFHAMQTYEINAMSDAKAQIVLESKVAKVRINTRRLRLWAGVENWDDLKFELTGTVNKYTLARCLNGDGIAKYNPRLQYTPEEYFATTTMNTFSSTETQGVEVHIFRDEEMIFCADRDSDGNMMHAQTGKVLDIDIDFTADAKISAKLKPWNAVEIGTEF